MATLNVLCIVIFLSLVVQGMGQCSLKDMSLNQTKVVDNKHVKPQWNVTITNNCYCSQTNVKIACIGNLSTKEEVDPSIDKIAKGSVEFPEVEEANEGEFRSSVGRKLLLFSGNDYLGLSAHPTIGMAVAKVAQEHGMGPRGSALVCGYTKYHAHLEASLADLKKKEDCLLCPTGFAANMAFMVAVGSIASLLASSKIPNKYEKVAVFSDALNHASIIDGLRLGERSNCVETFVYRHCDMSHLDALLSDCKMSKKVVVTDSIFSMDGDFAPLTKLATLRKKHGFLLVIDDAHGTFVCGKYGGGVAQEFNCESDVDVCIGTLSKAAGCTGGFIACRYPLEMIDVLAAFVFRMQQVKWLKMFLE